METTVVKALKVLEVLALEDEPCTLTLIASQCGITKSNAHRLLKTLEKCRYVRQDPVNKTHEPTLRLWELGTRIFGRVDVRAVAAPHLIRLARTTNESVHLSVFDAGEVIYVDKVDCTHMVRAYINIGERAPAYCTATGRAMLAFMPQDVVAAACRDLKRYTSHTLADMRSIKTDLAAIRERGYSFTLGEWREGVLGIGAPIRSETGAVVAGVGIAGPEERMRKANLDEMAAAVMLAAEATSSGLGLRGASLLFNNGQAAQKPPRSAASKA